MDREIGRFGQPIPADDPPIGTSAPRADSSFNGAFDAVERAERAILADLGLNGILQGGTAVQHTVGGNPSWSVEIAGPFAARDTAGKRITFADLLRTPSMQHDDNAVATAVTTSGKKRAVTLYAKAARANSCQHPDDNTPPNEIYALQTEDIGWSVVVGAEVLEASDLDLPPGGVAGRGGAASLAVEAGNGPVGCVILEAHAVAVGVLYEVDAHGFVLVANAAHLFMQLMRGGVIRHGEGQVDLVVAQVVFFFIRHTPF